MENHTSVSSNDLADRLAIRELVDAYATCADTRNAEGQMALFTEDTVFVVHMDSRASAPSYTLNGRASLAPVFANLNTYQATMHFNGQSTVELKGDSATGLSYCMAHHVSVQDGKQTLMIAHIRYLDQFVRQRGG